MLYCHLLIHAEIYIYMLDTYRRNEQQTHEGRRRKTSLTKCLPLTLLQGFEKVVWGFTVRGSWRSNITAIFWPQCYGCHVVSFLFSWCSTGGLGAHSAVWWLSLLHLISIFSGPQTPSGFPRATSVGCGFPYRISSPTVWNSTGNSTGPLSVKLNWNQNSIQLARRTQLSYIIVRRPLDLWNRMFNRHQAEITVMQFTGHSLPVHHFVVYHGNFFARPISSPNFRPRNFLS